ncbi:hypothetical protein PanWU01x14_073020 [Parasponia andersonii]|uniref:Uncharacterized protein n=1 Tax=Parasponia andersonii TaxID=3476 RepID=A0A2P5DDY3_PARAD|nr:hypothetical protein PanWU01x14_073020 [Parasponia andersonii]
MLLLRDADRNTNVGEKWYYICYPLRSFTQKIPQPVLNHGENPKVILIAATGSEFQVVCAFTQRRFHLISTCFELFDSEIKKRRVLQRVQEIKVEYGIYCQGITYWMLTNEPNKILAVDIKNGEVSYIHTALLERSSLIALLNKQLAIINITHHDEESFKLYTYDRENESWECLYTIDLSSCYGFFHPLRLLCHNTNLGAVAEGKFH